MDFEKLTTIIRSGRAGMPASVTLTCQGGGRPACQIYLSAEFATAAKISAGEKFDLFIGTGDDAGAARLVRSDKGVLPARSIAKGGIKFFCGHIEQFPGEKREREFVMAEVIDADTIEVVLPSWSVE